MPPQDPWIMSCHWTDIERRYVVPKYAGQTFFFADINEHWIYLGPPAEEQVDEKSNSDKMLALVIFTMCIPVLVFDLFLIYELFSRMREAGVW